MEYLPGNNLHKHLLENGPNQQKRKPLTLLQQLKFSVDVAKGMQHLSEAGVSFFFLNLVTLCTVVISLRPSGQAIQDKGLANQLAQILVQEVCHACSVSVMHDGTEHFQDIGPCLIQLPSQRLWLM